MMGNSDNEAENAVGAAIDAAENIGEPLEGVAEKVVADPTEASGEDCCDGGGRTPKQADILINLAHSAELFHDVDGCEFADLHINGHRETWSIRSKGFRLWLLRLYFEATGGAPNSEALQSALNTLEAKARFDAPQHDVFVRVGGLDGKLYLDLCDEKWRAVEMDCTEWRTIGNPPVRFRRPAGMRPLPQPVSGGSVEALRDFLNVRSDADFVLVVSWALACLRDRGPYPLIVVSGEQGSAKSTFSAILRSLLDPNKVQLRTLSRENRDLFIAANNGHVLAFDNLSGLPTWISDTLCRLSTGGGFTMRQLYTDQDEMLFAASRPVILNGIEDIVSRSDLADRAVFLTLEPIPEERRRSEAELWAAFELERPRILGALLDAVVEGLRRLPEMHPPKLPRMADFALWAAACETALWPAGTFLSVYRGNRDEVVEAMIEADPIATAVRSMMAEWMEWAGTATELLGTLEKMADEGVVRSKEWPSSPRALSGKLRRAVTCLRRVGVEIILDKREGKKRTRVIQMTRAAFTPENEGIQSSGPSAPSASSSKTNAPNGLIRHEQRTVVDQADEEMGRSDSTVRDKPLKTNNATDADGADAKFAPFSTPTENGKTLRWTRRL
jgi:hypothetical protein